MNSFGERLRYLRNMAKLSQNDLAKRIGVSKSSINMYERGEREPSFDTIKKFTNLFGVDANYLLGQGAISDKTITTTPDKDIVEFHVDGSAFSEQARQTLEKFFSIINDSAQPPAERLECFNEIRTEIFKTFSTQDLLYFLSILESVSAFKDMFDQNNEEFMAQPPHVVT